MVKHAKLGREIYISLESIKSKQNAVYVCQIITIICVTYGQKDFQIQNLSK